MPSLKIINMIRSRTEMRWQRVGGLLMIAVAASLLSVKLLLAVYAAAGDLDPSFGNGGKIEGVPDFTRFVIQADGKLVTIGSSPGTSNFLLSRLRVDGSLDSTFGVGGQVETNFGVVAFSNGLAIQSDGRIVAVGSKIGCSSCEKIVLVRYKTNGSLDTTFSADGIVEIPTNVNIHASTLALQPDGKIVVVGWVIDQYISPQPRRSFIIRLNEDGTLDQSFAADGILITTVWDSQPNSKEGFEDIVIQSNGKFVVLSIANVNSRMVRFFANGVRDWSFSNGQFDSPMSERNEHLALQPDGKIVMAANNFSSSNHYGLLVRLSADGILDTSFGQGGRTAGSIVQIGVVIVPPDFTGNINNYTLWYYTSDAKLAHQLEIAGINAQHVPTIDYNYEPSGTGNPSPLNVRLCQPGEPCLGLAGTVIESAMPAGSFEANWWVKAGDTIVKMDTLVPQISIGSANLLLTTDASNPLGQFLGGGSTGFPALEQFNTFKNARMTVSAVIP